MSEPPVTSRVDASVRSVRRLRVSWSVVRWAIVVLGLFGAAASVRSLISPPPPVQASSARVSGPDAAAGWYAESFARAYLTWDSRSPDAHAAALARFVGDGLDPDAGLSVPTRGQERVSEVRIVQQRRGDAGDEVFSVEARTDRLGVVYLSVGVIRRHGNLQLDGYPSFVGPPNTAPAATPDDGEARPVNDPMVRGTVRRALTNYLADQPDNLRADLAPDANVALPGLGLAVTRLDDIGWAPGGGAVEATVEASGPNSPSFTLRYEVDLTWRGGRPLVQAIQMDPGK